MRLDITVAKLYGDGLSIAAGRGHGIHSNVRFHWGRCGLLYTKDEFAELCRQSGIGGLGGEEHEGELVLGRGERLRIRRQLMLLCAHAVPGVDETTGARLRQRVTDIGTIAHELYIRMPRDAELQADDLLSRATGLRRIGQLTSSTV